MNTLYHDVLTWLAELPLHPDDTVFEIREPMTRSFEGGGYAGVIENFTANFEFVPRYAFCARHLRISPVAMQGFTYAWKRHGGTVMVVKDKACEECEAIREHELGDFEG
jgi:hypothetical protein